MERRAVLAVTMFAFAAVGTLLLFYAFWKPLRLTSDELTLKSGLFTPPPPPLRRISDPAPIGRARRPCTFDSEVLRDNRRRVLRYTSDEMKRRATRRVDVSDLVKQFDVKGTAVVDVVVDEKGGVVCTKSVAGHPLIEAAVETALYSWRFSPVEMNGKPVPYVGRLEFTLCNILCGEAGPSMSILK